MSNNKKENTKSLFSNNKFTLAFSFVLAFIIWISVAMVFSPETQRVIEDVPVKINMENSVPQKFDLQLFGQTEFTIDVTITGKRYIVGAKNINADSIEVVAQTGYVDSAGKTRLPLKVSLVDTTADYEIESYSAEYIEAYFDEYKEARFPLSIRADFDGEYIPEGYIQGDPLITLNSETVTEVKISGPAQEVNSIKNVYAKIDIKKQLTSTEVLEAQIVPTDEFGMERKYIEVNGEENPKATVTIPVLKIGEVNTSVDFSGVPSAYAHALPKTYISPVSVKVAMAEDVFSKTDALVLTELDFSSLAARKNTFMLTKDKLENSSFKVMDNTEVFEITVDLSQMSQKVLYLDTSKITLLNNKNSADISFHSSYIQVTVVGPEESIEAITEDNLLAEINLDNTESSSGTQETDVKMSLKNIADSWIYGTYKTTISVK